jgi:hypothetical protein
MIEVSNAWKDVQQRFLLPESYVEIDCSITDSEVQALATVSGTTEAVFSNTGTVLGESIARPKYATNELNLWSLDGTCGIFPDKAPYDITGYVSNIASTGSVTLKLPEVRLSPIAGVTVTWSDTLGEYPSVFTVTAKNGDTIVAENTITDNTQKTSAVFLEIANYDRITVTVHDWCLPNRRARIEKVVVGHVLKFTKNDIISFKHEQSGDLLSGELPKNSIEFTLNNMDGRWNPNNPHGMTQYLSERQRVIVRYGMDVNGTIEWIKAGTFYLSEWDAHANGFEARFVARDVFEFLFNEDKSAVYTTLYSMVTYDATYSLPPNSKVVADTSLRSYTAEYLGDGTQAEMVQKCANAARCIIRYDRDGVLYVEKFGNVLSDYRVPLSLSYAHPEITLAKPLKEVSVAYENNSVKYSVSSAGEKQTVNNDFITTQAQAQEVAEWVAGVLKNRKIVSGEFRADPRLDLFDVVTVESKYGEITPVVITNITYTFNGSFRGTYEGRVLEEAQ